MSRELIWFIVLAVAVGIGYIPAVQELAGATSWFGFPGVTLLVLLQTIATLLLLIAPAAGLLRRKPESRPR